MSGSDSTDITTTTTTTIVTPSSTEIEIVLDQETKKFFVAQENIPASCEDSKHLNQLLLNRSNSRLPVIRHAAVLSVLVIALITAVVAVCNGDLSKLSAAAVSFHDVAQTLALHNNGMSSS